MVTKQRKKRHILAIVIVIIFLLAFNLHIIQPSGAKYVMTNSITIPATSYYCDAQGPSNTEFETPTFNTIITVKNNDGTNYMTKDLEYTISCSNSKFDISAIGGLSRTITGGSKQSDAVNITITPKSGASLLGTEKIDVLITVTYPYNDVKTISLSVYNFSPITDGIGYSGKVPLNPLTGNITMTGYDAWPSGFSFTTLRFTGGVYDRNTKDIWLIPTDANMVVKMNTDTGAMEGYNTWPSGFTKGANAFRGGIGTDTDVWMIPFNADRVVKINKSTGVMTGYNTWPSGFTKGTSAFHGGALVGTDMWMAPYTADRVVKINTNTGVMTGYSAWPTGFVKGNYGFAGAIYDGQYVWMIPYDANMVVKIDPSTGTMTGYKAWPTGYTQASGAFLGGTFDGTNIWMTPYWADRVIKINTSTGVMTGYNTWPSGYNKGSAGSLSSSIYDGKTVWIVPFQANMIIGIDTVTGVMKGYGPSGTGAPWPTNFSSVGSSFTSTVYDGKDVWVIPGYANMIVKLSGEQSTTSVNVPTTTLNASDSKDILKEEYVDTGVIENVVPEEKLPESMENVVPEEESSVPIETVVPKEESSGPIENMLPKEESTILVENDIDNFANSSDPASSLNILE
ncbi:MAG: hypothetical protein FWF46_08025 [Oscillospiraceae bacterium]|nr:hypothetical protein [Oscillospiraceae bacterium]